MRRAKPSPGMSVRFTVDLPLLLHQEFSILAIKQGKSKADIVREAIARVLEETGQVKPKPKSKRSPKR